MKNSGMSFISILFALIIITILTLVVIRNYGDYQEGKTEEEGYVEAPIEEARGVGCLTKIKALTTDIKLYQVENDRLPQTLEGVTGDYSCPVSGEEYEYDETTGEVWCEEHG